MPSLVGRFMRDLPFLRQGLVPQEESGLEVESLDYIGEEHEKLSDDDVQDLARALCDNNKFCGNLLLTGNNLTDLTALHLASVFEKENGQNISKLTLDENNFTTKAGEYIGEALSRNPNYPLKELSFKGISLESIGLTRVIEACNLNTNIKSLHLGVLTDAGLQSLAQLLAPNTTLQFLTFSETKDHQKYWTEAGKTAMVEMLKNGTKLKRVEMEFVHEMNEDDQRFVNEMQFYALKNVKATERMEAYREILRSCEPSQMFERLQLLIENPEDRKDPEEKPPVRKFYNNTFGTLLNRAIFALTKKQSQHPNNPEFFTTQGMIKFVAFQLLDSPPEGEAQADEIDDDTA